MRVVTINEHPGIWYIFSKEECWPKHSIFMRPGLERVTRVSKWIQAMDEYQALTVSVISNRSRRWLSHTQSLAIPSACRLPPRTDIRMAQSPASIESSLYFYRSETGHGF